jgi:hypothetical protein
MASLEDFPPLRVKFSEKRYKEVVAQIKREGRLELLPYTGPWLLVEINDESHVHCFAVSRRTAEFALKQYNEVRDQYK